MIQLFLRRPDPRRFRPVKEVPTVRQLLKHWQYLRDQIPLDDHFQVSYTINNCTDNDREFSKGEIYAIDIDDINDDDMKNIDTYINVVANVLDVDRSVPGVIDSGYGLHFVTQHKTFTTDKFYAKNKHHNEYYLANIDQALVSLGLSGKCDRVIFNRAAMLRLPGTMNIHPTKKRDPRPAKLVQQMGPANIKIDITQSPATEEVHSLNPTAYANVASKAQPTEIMSRCGFIRSFVETPEIHSEPTWHAMLSIAALMGDKDKTGTQWAEELSAHHPRSNGTEWKGRNTREKLEYQASKVGPRTCKWIRENSAACAGCIENVSSPVSLVDEKTILTEDTGFHNIFGKRPTPEYEDLRRYFEREKNYKSFGDSKIVYTFNGKHYEPIEVPSMQQYAQKKFFPHADTKMCAEFSNRLHRTNIYPIAWWNRKKGYMNFNNGTLDLKTKLFTPHSPDDGMRYMLPYDYDPSATCELWDKTLHNIFGGDEAAQKIFMEYIGYCLSGSECWTQKGLLMVGDGANGKSTVVAIIKALAGDDNYTTSGILDLERSEYYRQLLDGKLFNVCEEMPTTAMLDTSIFKNLVTGGEVIGRPIFKNPYKFKPTAKIIQICNELPIIRDHSFGFWRRLIPIKFNQTFTKDTPGYDPHIEEKLKLELSGIANKAIEALDRLIKQKGFTESAKINQDLRDFQDESDSVAYWLKAHLEIHNNGSYEAHFAPTETMYRMYKTQTEEDGRKPVSLIHFSRQVRRMPSSFWEDHPIADREGKIFVQMGDIKERKRGLQGVQIH